MTQLYTGHIDPVWNLEEVSQLDYYFEGTGEFQDPVVVEDWQNTFGREFKVGMKADHKRPRPACQSQILDMLRQQGYNIQHEGCAWFRMLPGDIIPEHSDSYSQYCKFHGLEKQDVSRIIIFLQDWQPGFMFEAGGKSFSHYSAGTFVCWSADTLHMAGNLSRVPRYTLQITGVIS
jgi:hypothetical protein